ncbi:MAG: hypothetical protein NVSMB2_07350 [Chloroflexota bacterium]
MHCGHSKVAAVVPQDIALAGFYDFPFPWSDAFRPHLTTVAQPTYELGRQAADMLVPHLRNPAVLRPERVILNGKLMIRESSGALRSTRTARPVTVSTAAPADRL